MKQVNLFEQFINDRDIKSWQKKYGKLPIPKEVIKISKAMASAGFINKDSLAIQAKLWILREGGTWIDMKDKFGDNVGKFYGGDFYQEMQDTLSLKSSLYAFEVSKHVEDLAANEESVEPAYYLMKEYFNAFDMSTSRSRVFNSAVDKLTIWMNSNNIKTL